MVNTAETIFVTSPQNHAPALTPVTGRYTKPKSDITIPTGGCTLFFGIAFALVTNKL